MNAGSKPRPAAMLLVFAVASVLVGLIVSLFDPSWAIASIVGISAVGLVLHDYRVGAIALTFLLPWSWSPLVPQTHGFNLINFLIVASVASLTMRRMFSRESIVPVPKAVLWCYILPIVIATLVAIPHLPQGAANFPAEAPTFYQPFFTGEFLKSKFIKPMFFMVYAFVLANAIRDSKRPEGFVLVFGLSAALPALAVIVLVALGGGGMNDRGIYDQVLGLHVNEYGMQLALAAGPLAFLCFGRGPTSARVGSGLVFGMVSVALLLTGSRGAATAYAVIVGLLVLRRRRWTDLLALLALMAVLAVAVPGDVWDRLVSGLDDAEATNTHNMDDPLTKGRVAAWSMLAPDILISPVWGQGVGSTAWNVATTAGRYGSTHPHNMYLEVLLDLGIAGFVAVMYLYLRYARSFRDLARQESLPMVVRDYFQGAYASFLGMLAMAMTNGHYMPHPEQAFLWLAFGFLYAYWSLVERPQRGVRVPSALQPASTMTVKSVQPGRGLVR